MFNSLLFNLDFAGEMKTEFMTILKFLQKQVFPFEKRQLMSFSVKMEVKLIEKFKQWFNPSIMPQSLIQVPSPVPS